MITVIPEHPKNPIATKNGIHVADEKLLLTYLVDAAEQVKIFDFSIPAK